MEDYEDTRLLLRTLLEKKGIRVVEAGDGRAAMKIARKELPDLILMDFSLPGLDGIAATKSIRAEASTAHIPIVALSAHCSDARWREKAQAAGCAYCLSKPLDFAQLDKYLLELLPPPSPRPD